MRLAAQWDEAREKFCGFWRSMRLFFRLKNNKSCLGQEEDAGDFYRQHNRKSNWLELVLFCEENALFAPWAEQQGKQKHHRKGRRRKNTHTFGKLVCISGLKGSDTETIQNDAIAKGFEKNEAELLSNDIAEVAKIDMSFHEFFKNIYS